MYDQTDMDRYSFPQYPAAAKYPTAHSTSSAFSASANANEDWTKISDLAERRRIQNRIAQRNYRKKLKKRLEDLERRAGSSSASPEQRHEELPTTNGADTVHQNPIAQRPRSFGSHGHGPRHRTPEILAQQYVLPSDDRSMFAHQFTRQLSTSPPPFTAHLAMSQAESVSYPTYPTYCGSSIELPMYPQYIPPAQTFAMQNLMQTPIKQEVYTDDDVNPFSMSYASMANEITSYQSSTPSDSSSEEWQAGSPPLLDY